MQRPLLLLALLPLAGCGARWQALDPLDPHTSPALEGGVRFSLDIHGHRDFGRPFAPVWAATVESLHAGGLPVPESAREEARRSGSEVELQLDTIWMQVIQREPGRTCVLVRFRGHELEPGRAEAKVLLDEIQRRL